MTWIVGARNCELLVLFVPNFEQGRASKLVSMLNFSFLVLIIQTWSLFQDENALELVDPSLTKCNRDEAAMCIQLGLLCCQQSIAERPDMNSVHLMLSGDSFTLPKPGKPGIQGRGGRWTTTTSSAFTNTNTNTNTTNTNTYASSGTNNGVTKISGGNSFVEEYSRNSISCSSIDEGR